MGGTRSVSKETLAKGRRNADARNNHIVPFPILLNLLLDPIGLPEPQVLGKPPLLPRHNLPLPLPQDTLCLDLRHINVSCQQTSGANAGEGEKAVLARERQGKVGEGRRDERRREVVSGWDGGGSWRR